MRKTRLLILLLVLALMLTALAACNKTDGDNEPPENCEHVDLDGNGKCEICQADVPKPDDPTGCETHVDALLDGKCDVCEESYTTITIAEALTLCGESGNVTTERYYIRATVKTISNAAYGAMTIVDETGEIPVYGTYSADGALTFPELSAQPARGDEVILHCILQNYKGTKEVKNARLIGFKEVEADISEYEAMTVADAREAEAGELIILEGRYP